MLNAESRADHGEPRLLQRLSTPVFILVSLVVVPTAAFAALLLAIIVCMIAGVDHTDAQMPICLAALLVGFFGSIYLLAKARRPSSIEPQPAPPTGIRVPPPLPASVRSRQKPSIPEQATINRRSGDLAEPKPAIFETPIASTAFASREEGIDQVEQLNGRNQFRMIDWLQCWKTPVFFGIASVLIPLMAFQGKPNAIDMGILCSVLAFVPWAAISQLGGLYFDRNADKLSYPLFLFRRSVRLSAIADANCQTKMGHDDPFSILVSLIGLRATDDPKSKRYIVNLSGEFGARRIVLHSKYKRDQFLSLLQSFAPQCRITRWT